MLPVTANDPNVPTEVIFVCAAVVSVPTMLVPLRFPPVILPVAEISPPVSKLPPVTLPAVTVPVVDIVFEPNAAKNVATSALP